MNVTTEQSGKVSIVRVAEPRLMYPILSDFSSVVTSLVSAGRNEIVIDLTPVTYVDSATIGCLMDLYRQVHNAGGHLKLSGVQKRVETMLTMTGAQNFIEIHADEPSARPISMLRCWDAQRRISFSPARWAVSHSVASASMRTERPTLGLTIGQFTGSRQAPELMISAGNS